MNRSFLEDKEARRAEYFETKGREAGWLLLEIPNILVQQEGRGPAKAGYERWGACWDTWLSYCCTWRLLFRIITDKWRCQQAECEPAVASQDLALPALLGLLSKELSWVFSRMSPGGPANYLSARYSNRVEMVLARKDKSFTWNTWWSRPQTLPMESRIWSLAPLFTYCVTLSTSLSCSAPHMCLI